MSAGRCRRELRSKPQSIRRGVLALNPFAAVEGHNGSGNRSPTFTRSNRTQQKISYMHDTRMAERSLVPDEIERVVRPRPRRR